jgi:His/Glu/Gln/Arg/opine family amino acid ABC transporter permease subunit
MLDAVLPYWMVLLRGAFWTLALSGGALLLSAILGVGIAFARMSRLTLLHYLAGAYVEVFRSIPPLILFFGAYYGLSYATGISLSPYQAATVALTLFASPSMAEVVRSAVQSIPSGQWEASAAQGMRRLQQVRHVIWPQAFRIMLPAAVGVYVGTLKDSSLAAIIGFIELTKAGLLIREATGRSFEPFFAIAVLYFVINYSISSGGAWLERRFSFAR